MVTGQPRLVTGLSGLVSPMRGVESVTGSMSPTIVENIVMACTHSVSLPTAAAY